MLLVHKIELKPNNSQASYFSKACGTARFAYNWALSEWKMLYELGEKPSEVSLRRRLNAIKKADFPWMLEVTKVAPQQAIKNLGSAFKRFFQGKGKYPRFKKKGVRDSFRADNGPVTKGAHAALLEHKKIKLPRIGWVRLKESLRFKGQVKSVTISRKADRWYAAISVEAEQPIKKRKGQGAVGVDLGIHHLAILSNGIKIPGPKAHKVLLKRVQRLSRQLSKKHKGSMNRRKAKTKLARMHARINHIRQDSLHKLTTELVLSYGRIAIEDLNVKGMASNHKLARSIMDQSFYELRRQLEYKSEWFGSELKVIDRFYPSSKRCSACGELNDQLKLSDREWTCGCGVLHDRDINAAQNIEQCLYTVSSTEINACGTESAGLNEYHSGETMPC